MRSVAQFSKNPKTKLFQVQEFSTPESTTHITTVHNTTLPSTTSEPRGKSPNYCNFSTRNASSSAHNSALHGQATQTKPLSKAHRYPNPSSCTRHITKQHKRTKKVLTFTSLASLQRNLLPFVLTLYTDTIQNTLYTLKVSKKTFARDLTAFPRTTLISRDSLR